MSLLPTRAAIAADHGLNGLGMANATMRAVGDHALNEYLPGPVSLGRSTPEKRADFFAGVGALIGIDPKHPRL